MKTRSVLPLLLALALAACVPIQPGAMPQAQPIETPGAPGVGLPAAPSAAVDALTGTRWQLVSFGPESSPAPVLPNATITLAFGADGQAGGDGGCNSYGGAYQVQGSTLTFGQVASTLRACVDDKVTEQEQRYFQALQAAGQFAVTGERLTIWHDNRQGVLIFVAATSAAPIAPVTARPSIIDAPAPATPAVVLPALTPAEPPERVTIASDVASPGRSSLLPSGLGMKQYVLSLEASQTMTVAVTSDGVPLSLVVASPSGARWITEAAPAPAGAGYHASQTVTVPETGDYSVSLVKAEHTPSTLYRVDFTIQ